MTHTQKKEGKYRGEFVDRSNWEVQFSGPQLPTIPIESPEPRFPPPGPLRLLRRGAPFTRLTLPSSSSLSLCLAVRWWSDVDRERIIELHATRTIVIVTLYKKREE